MGDSWPLEEVPQPGADNEGAAIGPSQVQIMEEMA